MSKRKYNKNLGFERLESRALLAAGMDCEHNALLPEDTNGTGDVTAADALVVINQVVRDLRSGLSTSTANATSSRALMTDVNADGQTTAQDALVVVNRLSRVRNGGSLVSSVPLRNRIERLANDIESGSLPSYFDVATARAILELLQSGAYPELSAVSTPSTAASSNTTDDPVVDDATDVDSMLDDTSTTDSNDDTSTTTAGTSDDDSTDSIDDSSVTDVTAEDMTDSTNTDTDEDEDATDATDDGSTANADDDTTGTTDPTGSDDCDDATDRLTRLTAQLEQRLVAAGIAADAIASVIDPIQASIDSGEPLTRDDIKMLLTDAGIDLSLLRLPHSAGHPGIVRDPAAQIEHLSDVLLNNDANDPVVVQTLIDELTAADDAGTPLTRQEIKTRIEELGLTLPTPPEHPLRGQFQGGFRLANRIHAIRDAIFATLAKTGT